MTKINSGISVIIFNIWRLNYPIKRQRLSDYFFKSLLNEVTCCILQSHLKYKNTECLSSCNLILINLQSKKNLLMRFLNLKVFTIRYKLTEMYDKCILKSAL